MSTLMIVLGVIAYANIGAVVGLHIHRKPGQELRNTPAPLVGVIWPIIVVLMPVLIPNYLAERRKKKQAKALEEAKEAAKVLPPHENDPISVSEARELTGLQEKVKRMKQELEELDEEIGKRKADPQVVKAAKLLNRF